MKKAFIVLTAVLVLIVLASCGRENPSAGETVSEPGYVMQFQDGVYPSTGYAGSSDTNLDSKFADALFSTFNSAMIGEDGANVDTGRYVIRYDLTSLVPVNIRITKAYLSVNASAVSGSNTFTAYALTAPFNAPETTWNDRDMSVLWTSPGGDFSTIPKSNCVNMTVPGLYVFSLDTDMVKSWVASPSTNYGVIITASNETSGENYAVTGQNANTTAANRSMLTIYYTLP